MKFIGGLFPLYFFILIILIVYCLKILTVINVSIISSYKKSNLTEYYVPSILKAKNELGLRIKYSLKESINLTVKGLK